MSKAIDYPDVLGLILAKHDEELKQIGGCGDGYCLVTGKRRGQHTNGGCHCWNEKYRAQLAMRAGRRLRDQLAELLKANE